MATPSGHVESLLAGGYLLIVLAEPRSAEHKLAILKRLTKGLSSWSFEESGVNLSTELNDIVNQNIEGEEGKDGEQLFQYASDNLVAEILINPHHITLVQCVRNLLASVTKYRCIIYAGYSFTENGSWVIQDGVFSVADFLDAYKTAEAQRIVRLNENKIRVDLHCSVEGDWSQACRIKGTHLILNPTENAIESESINATIRWLCDKINVIELDKLLEASQVVGNIRFSRPTLYVFPAGQGDSALFGINGFNMLLDGGAGRNACFWGFARHLDRLDAILLTRLNYTNLEGVASFLKRKTMSSLYPQIGHFFCNFKARKQSITSHEESKHDPLSIGLIETAQNVISDLKQLQLRPHLCYRNLHLEPINLYHKVGHGKLDMYVLNPSKECKEVKEFLTKWNEGDKKMFNSSKESQFPIPNIISICTLLVWQPANPSITITRILFPGSCPQNKLFEALERVRHLEFLKNPSCSIKSLSSSNSMATKPFATKKTVLEKMIPGETKTVKTMENFEISAPTASNVIQTAIIPTAPNKTQLKPKIENENEKLKHNKIKGKEINLKSKIDNKYSSVTAKVNSNKIIQKNINTKNPSKLTSNSSDKSKENTSKAIRSVSKPKLNAVSTKPSLETPSKCKKEETNRKMLVASKTNSGLNKNSVLNIKLTSTNKEIISKHTSPKKKSGIVYKSSMVSGEKSGEDILIVEKLSITPEKKMSPDEKKIVVDELDKIINKAKNIICKEKCVDKLSDSGATTVSTIPEDEKISKENNTDHYAPTDKQKNINKFLNSLITPDEVADLPFHEEVETVDTKDKVGELVVETKKIVQVEKAEYVLVSNDSSPETLKRIVTDIDFNNLEKDEIDYTQNQITNEPQDDASNNKLMEHLMESSKDLNEITNKINDLKQQINTNKHLHMEQFQETGKKNLTNIISKEYITSSKHSSIKEGQNINIEPRIPSKKDSLNDDTQKSPQLDGDNTTITTSRKHSSISEGHNIDIEAKIPNRKDSLIDDTQKSPQLDDINKSVSTSSRQSSISEGHNIDIEAKIPNRKDSIKEEPQKSGHDEDDNKSTKTSSRQSSISEGHNIDIEVKIPSKKDSLNDDTQKSPQLDDENKSVTTSSKKSSISEGHNIDIEAKIPNRKDSIKEEPQKSGHDEDDNKSTKTSSRQSSISEGHNIDIEAKIPSRKDSLYDDTQNSPQLDDINKSVTTSTRQSSITEGHNIGVESKTLNRKDSIEGNPQKSEHDEDDNKSTKTSSRQSSISEGHNIDIEVKIPSKKDSLNDDTQKSPQLDDENKSVTTSSRKSSISERHNIDIEAKIPNRKDSIKEEPQKSGHDEDDNKSTKTSSRQSSISEGHNIDIEAKIPSRKDSLYDDTQNSPQLDDINKSVTTSTRQSSITEGHNIGVESKTLNRKDSIEGNPQKSEHDEDDNKSTKTSSRQSSISEGHNIDIEAKIPSRKDSLNDDTQKSPQLDVDNTTITTSSRQSSITEGHNIDIEAKIPSRKHSLIDDTQKSPKLDDINKSVTTSSRQSSISEGHNIDIEAKIPNRKDSIKEEPQKSGHDEDDNKSTKTSSRQSLISEGHNIDIEVKIPSRKDSIKGDPQKSGHIECDNKSVTTYSRQSSISEGHNIDFDAKLPSRKDSLKGDLQKSGHDEVDNKSTKTSSRQSSISEGHNIGVESITPSRKDSFNDVTQKSPQLDVDNTTIKQTTSSRQSSINEGHNIDIESKIPNRKDSIKGDPQKSGHIECDNKSVTTSSRQSSISEGHNIDFEAKTPSSKDSLNVDKHNIQPLDGDNTTITTSSRHSSISGGLNIDIKAKIPSRKDSLIDDTQKSPQLDDINKSVTTSSRHSSITEGHNIDIEAKIPSRKYSLNDDTYSSPQLDGYNMTVTNSSSLSSISEGHNIGVESKTASRKDSFIDDTQKSPQHEGECKSTITKSRQSPISEGHNIDIEAKIPNRKDSINDDTQKSPQLDDDNKSTLTISRQSSISETQKIGVKSNTQCRKTSFNDNKEKFLQHEAECKFTTTKSRQSSISEGQNIDIEPIISSRNDSALMESQKSVLQESNNDPNVLNRGGLLTENIQHEGDTMLSTILRRHSSISQDHIILSKKYLTNEEQPKSTLHDNYVNSKVEINKNCNLTGTNAHGIVCHNLDGFSIKSSVIKTDGVVINDNILSLRIEDKDKKFTDDTFGDFDVTNLTDTEIASKQSLGLNLNDLDLGVTKDVILQLNIDVQKALNQCSSDDEKPTTPLSDVFHSAMNTDDDETQNKADDVSEFCGSSFPIASPTQLDNQQLEYDFNKAMHEHRIARGEDLTATTTETNGNQVENEKNLTENDNINQNQSTISDAVINWGKPLGLPPIQSINNNGFDPIQEWGNPLGLPSPTTPGHDLSEPTNNSSNASPKKSAKKMFDNKPIINVIDKDSPYRLRRSDSPNKLRSRSSSRMSKINPTYLDLIYVPHHGNSKYVTADFFKRIRARNYVFSGIDPNKEVLNALIEGKQTWDDQELEVTIIPTYDTDTMNQWAAENEELLTKLKIDISPSASRCTIKLQDHNTSCSAYRLEF
ncbi:microtubule-associated protein 1B-like isoform X3 [Adelges cooleyi]|uniref:microtubule-associated protein 1B-like isoform X3 n=1 Tax=Adelges cooleyi TaxID=133065 RepID=UPI00217F8D00|nr:microtubule-associated protein 1B-like isoform X3 [Adelges cooleyi]